MKNLHLVPQVDGKKVYYASKSDFSAAIQRTHEQVIEKCGSPEPKIYYLNKDKKVCAIWHRIDRVGTVFEQTLCTN